MAKQRPDPLGSGQRAGPGCQSPAVLPPFSLGRSLQLQQLHRPTFPASSPFDPSRDPAWIEALTSTGTNKMTRGMLLQGP